MLELTDRAVDIIKQAVAVGDLPDGAGLRIAGSPDADTEASAFGASLAEEPDSQDEVIEVEGARVFLDPAASSDLDDKILDAQVQPGGGVAFGLGEQAV